MALVTQRTGSTVQQIKEIYALARAKFPHLLPAAWYVTDAGNLVTPGRDEPRFWIATGLRGVLSFLRTRIAPEFTTTAGSDNVWALDERGFTSGPWPLNDLNWVDGWYSVFAAPNQGGPVWKDATRELFQPLPASALDKTNRFKQGLMIPLNSPPQTTEVYFDYAEEPGTIEPDVDWHESKRQRKEVARYSRDWDETKSLRYLRCYSPGTAPVKQTMRFRVRTTKRPGETTVRVRVTSAGEDATPRTVVPDPPYFISVRREDLQGGGADFTLNDDGDGNLVFVKSAHNTTYREARTNGTLVGPDTDENLEYYGDAGLPADQQPRSPGRNTIPYGPLENPELTTTPVAQGAFGMWGYVPETIWAFPLPNLFYMGLNQPPQSYNPTTGLFTNQNIALKTSTLPSSSYLAGSLVDEPWVAGGFTPGPDGGDHFFAMGTGAPKQAVTWSYTYGFDPAIPADYASVHYVYTPSEEYPFGPLPTKRGKLDGGFFHFMSGSVDYDTGVIEVEVETWHWSNHWTVEVLYNPFIACKAESTIEALSPFPVREKGLVLLAPPALATPPESPLSGAGNNNLFTFESYALAPATRINEGQIAQLQFEAEAVLGFQITGGGVVPSELPGAYFFRIKTRPISAALAVRASGFGTVPQVRPGSRQRSEVSGQPEVEVPANTGEWREWTFTIPAAPEVAADFNLPDFFNFLPVPEPFRTTHCPYYRFELTGLPVAQVNDQRRRLIDPKYGVNPDHLLTNHGAGPPAPGAWGAWYIDDTTKSVYRNPGSGWVLWYQGDIRHAQDLGSGEFRPMEGMEDVFFEDSRLSGLSVVSGQSSVEAPYYYHQLTLAGMPGFTVGFRYWTIRKEADKFWLYLFLDEKDDTEVTAGWSKLHENAGDFARTPGGGTGPTELVSKPNFVRRYVTKGVDGTKVWQGGTGVPDGTALEVREVSPADNFFDRPDAQRFALYLADPVPDGFTSPSLLAINPALNGQVDPQDTKVTMEFWPDAGVDEEEFARAYGVWKLKYEAVIGTLPIRLSAMPQWANLLPTFKAYGLGSSFFGFDSEAGFVWQRPDALWQRGKLPGPKFAEGQQVKLSLSIYKQGEWMQTRKVLPLPCHRYEVSEGFPTFPNIVSARTESSMITPPEYPPPGTIIWEVQVNRKLWKEEKLRRQPDGNYQTTYPKPEWLRLYDLVTLQEIYQSSYAVDGNVIRPVRPLENPDYPTASLLARYQVSAEGHPEIEYELGFTGPTPYGFHALRPNTAHPADPCGAVTPVGSDPYKILAESATGERIYPRWPYLYSREFVERQAQRTGAFITRDEAYDVLIQWWPSLDFSDRENVFCYRTLEKVVSSQSLVVSEEAGVHLVDSGDGRDYDIAATFYWLAPGEDVWLTYQGGWRRVLYATLGLAGWIAIPPPTDREVWWAAVAGQTLQVDLSGQGPELTGGKHSWHFQFWTENGAEQYDVAVVATNPLVVEVRLAGLLPPDGTVVRVLEDAYHVLEQAVLKGVQNFSYNTRLGDGIGTDWRMIDFSYVAARQYFDLDVQACAVTPLPNGSIEIGPSLIRYYGQGSNQADWAAISPMADFYNDVWKWLERFPDKTE